MRVASLAQLNQLSMNPAHKAKIAAQLQGSAGGSSKQVDAGAGVAPRRLVADTSETGSHPQRVLWNMLHAEESAKHYAWVGDFVGAVPGRKFELDVASPRYRIGIEVDGWLWHGKRKQDFLRDREKDYLLSIEGWQVLRLQAGLIYKEPGLALERVQRFMAVWVPRQERILDLG